MSSDKSEFKSIPPDKKPSDNKLEFGTEIFEGTIKNSREYSGEYRNGGAFGFIEPKNGGKDLFYYTPLSLLAVGTRVLFQTALSVKGPAAKIVKVADANGKMIDAEEKKD